MKKILLYIILFLSGIDGAWALPIEKEGMSIYSPSLKQEVSYSIILPEGYEHSDTEYPVLYMFHGIGLYQLARIRQRCPCNGQNDKRRKDSTFHYGYS